MKPEFNHPVIYDDEIIALLPSAEEAARFHAALHAHEDELEIAPPPMVGLSGIPEELFERGQSEMFTLTKVVECPPSIEEFEKLTKDWIVDGKDVVGGKVMLSLRRR